MSNVLKMLSRGGAAAADTDPNFKQTVLLLHGDGTNGAQNNTFLDSSTNNFTITRNGNTTQGTFSPFSLAAGEWSNYFDGTVDNLSIPTNTAFAMGTGDFTIEAWIYVTAYVDFQTIIVTNSANPPANTTLFLNFRNSTNQKKIALTSWTAQYAISNVDINLNEWTHVACVVSSGSSKIYINGSGGTAVAVSENFSSANNVLIGGGGGAAVFNGYISNLRVVKGRAVYTSNFTPPTAPLGATSGGQNPPQGTETSLLTCQSNRFVDNSTNAFAITRNGDVRVTPFSPFAPTAAYSAGTNGGSGYFDGTGDYLQTPSNSAVSAWSTDCTIECWFYLESLSTVRVLLGNSTANSDGFFLAYVLTDGKIAIGRVGVNEIASAAGVITTNQWYHVAFIKSSTTAIIYVNGVSVASGASSAAFETATTKPFSVGANFQSSGAANWLGYVSNVRLIKNQALTTGAFTPPTAPVTSSTVGWTGANVAASITGAVGLLLNFTNAGIIDNTGKNNLETVGNAQIDTAVKKFGTGSMEFDGSGDELIASEELARLGTGDFTVECWWKVNVSSGDYQTIIEKGIVTGTPVNGSWSFGTRTNTTVAAWFAYYNSGFVDVTGTGNANDGNWHHLAVTREGTSLRLFSDGTLLTTHTLPSNFSFGTGNTLATRIGYNQRNNRYINGFIDDLRITKGVARYTANFTAPTKEFPDL